MPTYFTVSFSEAYEGEEIFFLLLQLVIAAAIKMRIAAEKNILFKVKKLFADKLQEIFVHELAFVVIPVLARACSFKIQFAE